MAKASKNRHWPTTSHNYLKEINRMIELGKLSGEQVSHLKVLHDNWCDSFKGKFCNCNPELHLMMPAQAAEPIKG